MLFRITLLILGLAAGTIYALKGQFFLKLDLLAPQLFVSVESTGVVLLVIALIAPLGAALLSYLGQARVMGTASIIIFFISAFIIATPSALGIVQHNPVDYPQRVALDDSGLNAKDWVVGMELKESSIAYPATLLEERLVVIDEIEGTRFVIVYCESCKSPLAYETTVMNIQTDFEVIGIYKIDPVIQDQLTNTWWDAGTGEALAGPLKSQMLERIPVTMSPWGQWLELNPDTLLANIEEMPVGKKE